MFVFVLQMAGFSAFKIHICCKDIKNEIVLPLACTITNVKELVATRRITAFNSYTIFRCTASYVHVQEGVSSSLTYHRFCFIINLLYFKTNTGRNSFCT